MRREDAPRSPGYVHATLALVMAVAIGALGLNVRQPPPPSIAELAPRAQEQIKDAPPEQSSRYGRGPAGDGLGGLTPGPGGGDPPIDVARVRRCVGVPPRQIEDPQSPPCVPYWDGDNGGATYQGVTKDEIVVALPRFAWENSQFNLTRAERALEAFFNKRFEFYGRKLKLIKVITRCCGTNPAPSAMVADAVMVDEELRAFASTSYSAVIGVDKLYYEELARRKVISVNGAPPSIGEDVFEKHDPYIWSYLPGIDVMERHVADWACKGLKGRLARFSKDATLATSERSFGLVWTTSSGYGPDLRPLRAALAECGIDIAAEGEAPMPNVYGDQAFISYQNLMIKLRSAGVTSVICMCQAGATQFYMEAATNQGFFPEWYVNTYYLQDDDAFGVLWPRTQADSAFGITFWNRLFLLEDEPWWWAIKEVDPTFTLGDPRSRSRNTDNSDAMRYAYENLRVYYYSLLVLASGIQMAGPTLTPETFRDGLYATKFPNPNAGRAPYFQSHVNFGPRDHSMNGDGALIWYSSSQPSYLGYPGGWCYGAGGKRYALDEYPTDANLRSGSCH